MESFSACCTSTLILIFAAAILLLVVLFAPGFGYYWSYSKFDYWQKRGIKIKRPIFPFFGSLISTWGKNIHEVDLNDVKKYGKMYGIYDGKIRRLVVADHDLAREVFIKQFENFPNRELMVSKKPVSRKMLSILTGQEWKNVRAAVSPIFSSGKIKRMGVLIDKCAENLLNLFGAKITTSVEHIVDLKEIFGAFVMDVIARCAFGTEIQTIGEIDDPFVQRAKMIFRVPMGTSLWGFLPYAFPWIAKFWKSSLVSETIDFFAAVAEDLMTKRRAADPGASGKKGDLIDLLLEAQKQEIAKLKSDLKPGQEVDENEIILTDEVIKAQAIIFFLAGYDTSSTVLTELFFLLAKHPEIQEKLLREVNKENSDEDGTTYDYLDMVLYETMRMFPPAPRTSRTCMKATKLGGMDIEAYTLVTLPTYALNHDEDVYPDPFVFNPERFDKGSPEYASNFHPFGVGPRMCPAARFAMRTMKTAIRTVLPRFKFSIAKQMPEMEMRSDFYSLTPVKALVVAERRN